MRVRESDERERKRFNAESRLTVIASSKPSIAIYWHKLGEPQVYDSA